MTGANKTRALVLIADGTEEMEAVITSMSTHPTFCILLVAVHTLGGFFFIVSSL